MAINCCYGCVAPKRYPGRHDHCPDIAKQKAQRDKEMAAVRQKKAIQVGITSQKIDGVLRACRRKGRR